MLGAGAADDEVVVVAVDKLTGAEIPTVVCTAPDAGVVDAKLFGALNAIPLDDGIAVEVLGANTFAVEAVVAPNDIVASGVVVLAAKDVDPAFPKLKPVVPELTALGVIVAAGAVTLAVESPNPNAGGAAEVAVVVAGVPSEKAGAAEVGVAPKAGVAAVGVAPKAGAAEVGVAPKAGAAEVGVAPKAGAAEVGVAPKLNLTALDVVGAKFGVCDTAPPKLKPVEGCWLSGAKLVCVCGAGVENPACGCSVGAANAVCDCGMGAANPIGV